MSGINHSPEIDSSISDADGPQLDRGRRNVRGFVVLVVLFLLVALLGVLHITRSTAFSPFDEFVHFDTLEKNSRFVLVGRGERISQTTMREVACHGIDLAWEFDSCDAESYDYNQFPGLGWNTAYNASPLYYGATGIAGRFVKFAAPPINSLLTASRLITLLWALLAAGLVWLLLGEFSIPYSIRFFVVILIASAPTVLHLSSIVNPDVTGMVGGAAIAWLTVRWERGVSPAWLLTLVATLTVLGKPLNAAAVGAMAVYLVIRHLQERRIIDADRFSSPTRGVAALFAGVLLGAVPWLIIQGALATVPASQIPMVQLYGGATLTLDSVTSQFTAVVSPLRAAFLPAFIAGPLIALVAVAADILLLGGNIGVALLSPNHRASALATTSLITGFLLGPAVVIFIFVSHDGFLLPASPRYGLPLLPLFAVGLAIAAKEKMPGRIALGVLATSSFAVILTEMIGVM